MLMRINKAGLRMKAEQKQSDKAEIYEDEDEEKEEREILRQNYLNLLKQRSQSTVKEEKSKLFDQETLEKEDSHDELEDISHDELEDMKMNKDFIEFGNENEQNSTGILLSMKLINFMCHENLRIDFSDKINFIVGQNGSGKSAILTALMVCLGATATKTQRGHKVSDLIRENAPFALIIVTMNNTGLDKYRENDYGRKIIIERKISRDGLSTYKTKSISGRVVSTKKEEILSICQFFRLQVENPMTILTQDIAKRYLAASSPEEKYQFFLKGTYLDQLAQDYEYILNKVYQMGESLESAKLGVSTLEQEVTQLKSQIESLKQLRTMSEHLNELKKEVVWAIVHEKEQELGEFEKTLRSMEKRFEQHLNSRNNVSEQIKEIQNKVKIIENDNKEVQTLTIRPLDTSFQQIQTQLKTYEQQLRKVDEQKSEIAKRMESCHHSLRDIQKMIEEESKNQTASQINLKHELETGISTDEKKVSELNTQINEIERKQSETEKLINGLYEKQRSSENSIQTAQAKSQNYDIRIKQLLALKKDHSKIYGAQIPSILQYLASNNYRKLGFKQAPIGPIGMYVQLKDNDWSVTIDAIIGRFLSSFVVTEYDDRELLKSLLKKFNCDNQIVLKRHNDNDFKEPPLQFLTAYRVLDIKNEIVGGVLRTLSGLERILLARTRPDATNMLNSRPPNTDAAFTIDGVKITCGRDTQSYFSYGSKNHSSKFFDDPETLIKGLEKSLNEVQKELELYQYEKSNLTYELNTQNQAVRCLTQELNQLNNSKRQLLNKIKDLKRRLEIEIAQPESKSNLVQERERNKERVELLQRQIDDLLESKNLAQEKKQRLEDSAGQILRELDTANENFQTNRKQIEMLMKLRNDLEGEIYQFESKSKRLSLDIHVQKEKVTETTLSCEQERVKSLRYCEEVNTSRTPVEVDKEIKLTEHKLSQQPVNIENMNNTIQTLERKGKELAIGSAQVQSMNKLVDTLKLSIEMRQLRWHEFRKHISLRSRTHFTHLMSMRNFLGELHFDHTKGRLNIIVDTNADGKKKLRMKDIKSLSGGEKSVTTMCFLLSLWESMESQLRCLDEFDVFMDSVNRRVVLDMLLNFAKASKLQYIFITPQALKLPASDSTNESDNDIRITRMRDPERKK